MYIGEIQKIWTFLKTYILNDLKGINDYKNKSDIRHKTDPYNIVLFNVVSSARYQHQIL